MNVAALYLCRELDELSGWNTTEFIYANSPHKGTRSESVYDRWRVSRRTPRTTSKHSAIEHVSAYDLGYLLRKLPKFYEEGKTVYLMTLQPNPIGAGWQAHYRFASRTPNSSDTDSRLRQEAETPEDAACRLAIELFKQGILKPVNRGPNV